MVVNKNRGDTVDVTISLKNTGASAAKFSLAIEFDTMVNGSHWDSWHNGVTIADPLNPQETQNYMLSFTVPDDAPLDNDFAVSVFVYPEGEFDPGDPDANKLHWDTEYDIVHVITGVGGAEVTIISVD